MPRLRSLVGRDSGMVAANRKAMMMTTLTHDATALHLVQAGPEGSTPIVLLHSAGLDLTFWDRQIVALGADHRLISLDLPGHGESPTHSSDWHGRRIAETISNQLATLNTDGVHLVGMSFGGALAQQIALLDPARVRSLTLIDTGARFSEPARAAMRARAAAVRANGVTAVVPGLIDHWFLASTVRDRPDLIARATRTLLRQDPEVHAAMWELMANDYDISDQVGSIACPTLVIVGEHDSSSPVATSQQLRDLIPNATLRVVPNAAHLSAIERPEIVNRLIADHVASVA